MHGDHVTAIRLQPVLSYPGPVPHQPGDKSEICIMLTTFRGPKLRIPPVLVATRIAWPRTLLRQATSPQQKRLVVIRVIACCRPRASSSLLASRRDSPTSSRSYVGFTFVLCSGSPRAAFNLPSSLIHIYRRTSVRRSSIHYAVHFSRAPPQCHCTGGC